MSFILLQQMHCMHPAPKHSCSGATSEGSLCLANIQVFLGCRQILSLKSEVFCSLLLSADVCEVGNQTEVPLEDCTLAEANIFLRYIYMREPVTDEYQAEGLTKVRPCRGQFSVFARLA